MIANVVKYIKSVRRSGLAMMAARWRIHFIINFDILNSQGFSLHTPYAAIIAPRSRRDKDMSDHKAIKQTIRVLLG